MTIEQKDIFTLDLSKANVVTLYLLPSLNVKLIPQLEKLKPGSRIVSHDFDMQGVKPDKVVDVRRRQRLRAHGLSVDDAPEEGGGEDGIAARQARMAPDVTSSRTRTKSRRDRCLVGAIPPEVI